MKKQPSKSNQAEALRQQRIKAARKPAHTEVFEGYGVMIGFDPQKIGHFKKELKEATDCASTLRNFIHKTVHVVKVKMEFKVI